ncbi:MAG: hypothetical protein KAQ70_03020 [Candidatus Heimdallarchaeota archaeon]|nr:hypothetical protein [Candidatus Heimdallarchaeota archaeon]
MGKISEAIKLDMESVFKMLKVAVSKIEGDFWKEKKNSWMYGYTLFHAIEAIEYYMSNSKDDWIPLSDVSANSEEIETNTIRTRDKQFFENYLSEVETKTFDVLTKLSEEDFLETDGFSERGFTSRLHKYSSVVRHTMVHVGELSKTTRDLEKNGIRWQ